MLSAMQVTQVNVCIPKQCVLRLCDPVGGRVGRWWVSIYSETWLVTSAYLAELIVNQS